MEKGKKTERVLTSYISRIMFVMTVIFACLWCSYETYAVESELESTYRSIFSGDLGYTLIGEKPISSSNIADNCLLVPSRIAKKCISSLQETFKISDTYIFKVLGPIEDGHIELIHKPSVREVVSKNASLRNFIRERFKTTESFFSYMEDESTSIFDFDAYFRGILFGYGEENSKHFCRYIELGVFLKKHPFIRVFPMMWAPFRQPDFPEQILYPYMVKIPKVGDGFESLEEEWEWLQSLDIDFATMRKERVAKPPCYIDMPIYRSKKCVESEALHKKYVIAKAKIANLFSKTRYQEAVEERVKTVRR